MATEGKSAALRERERRERRGPRGESKKRKKFAACRRDDGDDESVNAKKMAKKNKLANAPRLDFPIKRTSHAHPLCQGCPSTPPWNSWGAEESASSLVSVEAARALARRKASERPEAAVVDVVVGLPSSSVSATALSAFSRSPYPLPIAL